MAGETAAVINAGGGGGGGLAASIPGGTRTLVIGGAAAAAMLLVLVTRGGKGADAGDSASSGRLDASENIALGQVAYETRAAAGEASIRDAEIMAGISGLAGQLGTYGSALGGLDDKLTTIDTKSNQLLGGFFNLRSYQDANQNETRLLLEQLLGLGFNIREYQDAYAAAPPYSLAAPLAGGQLATQDVETEPLVTVD